LERDGGPEMPSAVPMLQVTELRAGYGGIPVLQGIDLVVNQGELVTLLGSNGAGKTTTLKALSGLLRPSGGTVRFCGEVVTGTRPERMVARGVSHIPEGREILARLTVEENLLLGAFRRRDKAQVRADIADVYGRFPALATRRRQVAGTLSGGEQQMLAIGRALVGRPRLIMLDEPSLGLSPLLVDQVFALIGQLKEEGMTILLVEQSTRHALRLADQAYVLAGGKVVLSGTAAEMLAREDLVQAAYLGSAGRPSDGDSSS